MLTRGSFATEPVEIKFATAIIPPYQLLDADDQLKGRSVAILECAMAPLNQSYSVSVLPWLRAQMLVEKGEFDAFFIASENAERNRYAKISRPLFDSSWIWFYPKKSLLDPSSDSFAYNASVGGVFGTNMNAWLKKYFEYAVIKTTADELFKLLSVERLDAILLTELMFKDSVKRLGLKESDFKRVVAKKRPLGVYFGNTFLKKHPEWLSQFNQSIKNCQSPRPL